MAMSLTLNGIDDATAEWLKAEAERKRVSVESLAVDLIQRAASPLREEPSPTVHHDMDPLAGTWTEGEATEFLKTIEDFESIDERLWR